MVTARKLLSKARPTICADRVRACLFLRSLVSDVAAFRYKTHKDLDMSDANVTLAAAIDYVNANADRLYDLQYYNCQHFARELFDHVATAAKHPTPATHWFRAVLVAVYRWYPHAILAALGFIVVLWCFKRYKVVLFAVSLIAHSCCWAENPLVCDLQKKPERSEHVPNSQRAKHRQLFAHPLLSLVSLFLFV